MTSFHFPHLHLWRSKFCLLIRLLPREFWYPCIHPASFLPPILPPLSIPGTCPRRVLTFGNISAITGTASPPTHLSRKGSGQQFALCRVWRAQSSCTRARRSLCPWFWNASGINLVPFHWRDTWFSQGVLLASWSLRNSCLLPVRFVFLTGSNQLQLLSGLPKVWADLVTRGFSKHR